MYLRQRANIIFRKLLRISRAFASLRVPPTSCPGSLYLILRASHSFVVFAREEGEYKGRNRKNYGGISYHRHVRAEVNFERRMSLLKLSVSPSLFLARSPSEKKSFFKHNCARISRRLRRIISVHPRYIATTRCFPESPGKAARNLPTLCVVRFFSRKIPVSNPIPGSRGSSRDRVFFFFHAA